MSSEAGIFDGIDYRMLEERTLRNLAKSVNFGRAYGMGPQSMQKFVDYAASDAALNLPMTKACPSCSAQIPHYIKTHAKRECQYMQARMRQELKGNVPALGIFNNILMAGRIPFERDHYRTRHEALNKHGQLPPLQNGNYAPVWAILLVHQAGLGALTSPKRPKVKRLIETLQQVVTSVEEQRVILGEHILAHGPYTAACRALIGRLME